MEYKNRKRAAWLHFLTTLLLCIAFLTLILGTVYARYTAEQTEEFQMVYEAKTNQISIIQLDMDDSTVIPENTRVIHFMLTNQDEEGGYCTYDQVATLSLHATIGTTAPENFKVTLTDGETVYNARYEKVVAGSTLESQYGPGWLYRFYNEAGEELSWYFAGGQSVAREMTMTIVGKSELPTKIDLMVSARPGEL